VERPGFPGRFRFARAVLQLSFSACHVGRIAKQLLIKRVGLHGEVPETGAQAAAV